MRAARLLLRRCAPALWVAVWLVAGAADSWAIEVWMPETGEVALEEQPRDSAEARRRHALALIGAGQWAGGVAELRRLIEAEPEAEWVPEAQFAIARGLLALGRPTDAFDELEELSAQHPDLPFAAEVRSFQFTAARLEAARDVDAGVALYDRLIETATAKEEDARARKEIGDAFFEARRYLDAQDAYMAFTDFFADSEWYPYCWYRIAECEWELARWLELGLERVEVAEAQFIEFMNVYPTDASVPEARQKAAEARSARAAMHGEIARYYIEAAKKPWAAVSYLEYIRGEFPDSPEAQWAARELEKVDKQLEVPLRGRIKEFTLPGAGWIKAEQ